MLYDTKVNIAFSAHQGVVYASPSMGETRVLGGRHRRYRDHDRRLWLAGVDPGQHRGVPGAGTDEYGACRRLHAHLRREVYDATRCAGETDRVPNKELVAARGNL